MKFIVMLFIEAVLTITGAYGPEELDEQLVEHFEQLQSRPLRINSSSMRALLNSGLFTPFQAASVLDYRRNSGDILSQSELGLLDGFSPTLAEALSLFVSFESAGAPGQRKPQRYRDELYARWKSSGDLRVRYSGGTGGGFDFSLTGKGTFSLAWKGRGGLINKVIAGDFNARYGQGLLLWSGMGISGYQGVAAFMRKGTGLGPSRSFSRENRLRGLAVSLGGGGFNLDLWADAGGLLLGINAGLVTLKGQASLTALCGKDVKAMGLEGKWAFGRTVLFGEGVFDLRSKDAKASAGLYWDRDYLEKYALLLRCGPEDGIALGAGYHSFNATLDASRRRSDGRIHTKLISSAARECDAGGWTVKPGGRLALRWRPADANPLRAELRAEVQAGRGGFLVRSRFDFVHCKGGAALGYLELGCRREKAALYLRGGLYDIPHWDDRIYVYERDAPETFNVPAYYGKGWFASLVCNWNGWYLRLERRREVTLSLCCRIPLVRARSRQASRPAPTQ